MTDARREAVQEARALLRLCRDESGASGEATLALIVRAMERLADAIEADAIEAGAATEEASHTAAADDGTAGTGRKFDRSRPARGYNRDE